MSITILGAGAIGMYLGARLASAGEDVVLIARGDHQRAIAAQGVQVRDAEGHRTVSVPCYGSHEKIRPADVVILTAKAHDLQAMLPLIHAARKPNATIVAAQNGVPWWYFQRHGGELDGIVLESVDPGGVLARSIDPEHVAGCVIYCPVTVLGPGIVEHEGPRRLEIGHPSGELTPSLGDVARSCEHAGFAAPRSRNLRREIWIKLLANVPLNPLGALVRKTSGEIAQHPTGKQIVGEIMRECLAVAKGTGLALDISVEERLAQIPRQVGNHKSSMLQDVERGRRLELGPLVGAVVELGDRLGIDVSVLRYVYFLAQMI
jgi:2-dehydropantoate 2-reductase